MKTTCNNCLDEFDISPKDIISKQVEDLEIQYFVCPSCGAKYVVYAADEGMKNLTQENVRLQKIIRIARARRFREKAIRDIEDELSKVRARQKANEPSLKERAERLLEGIK